MYLHDFKTVLLAWLPAVLIIALSIIYPLRLYCQRKRLPQSSLFVKANRFLRKIHKEMGLSVIFLTFIHCRTSSQKPGINIGTFCLILLFLLWLSYLLRKQLKKNWIILHRCFTAILLGFLVVHILVLKFTDFNI